MMSIEKAQRYSQSTLRQAGIDSARLDTCLLLEKVTRRPRSWLSAHPDEKLSDKQASAFTELVERRAQRVPLVHLTNHREFYGLDFYVDERVLTPRVETEKMVDYAIKYAPSGSRLVDIGTGCGALAIAIAKHRPDLEITATDVTDEALNVAAKNVAAHNVSIDFIKSDLLGSVSGRFETVVTNLPYLRDDARDELMPEVRNEPGVALFGGSDGLDLYRQLLAQLYDRLEPGGYLFTECDPWQHTTLIAEAAKTQLKPIEQNDYFALGFQLAS